MNKYSSIVYTVSLLIVQFLSNLYFYVYSLLYLKLIVRSKFHGIQLFHIINSP